MNKNVKGMIKNVIEENAVGFKKSTTDALYERELTRLFLNDSSLSYIREFIPLFKIIVERFIIVVLLVVAVLALQPLPVVAPS